VDIFGKYINVPRELVGKYLVPVIICPLIVVNDVWWGDD
jgi:hypothetical protein